MTEITCPRCGTANPATNRFCGNCGSPLAGASGAPALPEVEERKVVTMLFADLAASTEMASRLDPEDLRAVLRPYFEAMAREVDRFDGTVEKFIGDAVVAVFGAPAAHEDDPERAVRCALAMHRRLDDLNRELADRAGGDLALRIGVNTGEVIAHGIEEGIVTGEAVNIAARLQVLADPGTVVVGERTRRHTRGAFDYADLGEVNVRGIDRPLRVWRVEGERAGAASTSGTPFVGRDVEMERLRDEFDRALREGRPRLVTIVGPPGIGKSRLSHEVERTLRRDHLRVLRGRCLPYGDGLTYWPLAEILKADAGILDSDEPEVIREKARARLDPRFPGDEGIGITGLLLSSIGVELPSDPLAGTDPEAAAGVIARAWQRYLETMTAEGPVLALIEDIHWADPSLLDLIETVLGRAAGPALVLCMARPDLFERRPGWADALPNATTVPLSPLSERDGASLIEHLLGGRAPREAVTAILRRSEGNPFFTGELLRMMIEDGTFARTNGSWRLVRELPTALPDTVQGVIASRIDRLPAPEKRVLQGASVVGRVFWPGAVQRLAPVGGDVLDRLVDKGLVLDRQASSIAGERELIFNHILTRDVAYAGLPRARRENAHAVVGEWVEEMTRGRAEEFAEVLAYHFESGGDDERAARYAMLAGNRHLRVFAATTAIEWYERALHTAPSNATAIRSRIELQRGAALEQIGRFADALAAYETALESATAAGDAELEARALAAQPHVLWLQDRYDEGRELLPRALERAREVGLADVEARLLYTAGTIRFGRGEFAEALPLHHRALEVATAAGDVEGQALAHHGLCETYFFLWPVEKSLEHGRVADRLLRELGQRSMVAHNEYMVSWGLEFLGRWDEAFATVDSSIETSREIGNRREEAFALYSRAELNLAVGRLDEAWAAGEAGITLFRELGLPRGEIIGWGVLNDVAAEAGDLERMVEQAADGLRICELLGGVFMRPNVLAYAGWADLVAGKTDRAEKRLGLARTFDDAPLSVAWSGCVEVQAREWARDPGGLRSIASRLEELVLPRSAFWGAWAPYARGAAALLDGSLEEALAEARRASELAGEAGDRRLRWRAGRVAWLAAERLGRDEEAARYREQAVESARAVAGGASGRLLEAFLARPDVAEILG
ncbi:MAG TPA: adenylate/guanylate cyclase domain-containing protein [Actinomycetota bacterium]